MVTIGGCTRSSIAGLAAASLAGLPLSLACRAAPGHAVLSLGPCGDGCRQCLQRCAMTNQSRGFYRRRRCSRRGATKRMGWPRAAKQMSAPRSRASCMGEQPYQGRGRKWYEVALDASDALRRGHSAGLLIRRSSTLVSSSPVASAAVACRLASAPCAKPRCACHQEAPPHSWQTESHQKPCP